MAIDASEVALLRDTISRIGQRLDVEFPADARGGVYGPQNMTALLDVVDAAALDQMRARTFTEPCPRCGGHGMIMDWGGPDDCPDCTYGVVARTGQDT